MAAVVTDPNATEEERREAIASLRSLKNDLARDTMVKLISTERRERLVIDALGALSEIGGDTLGDFLIGQWSKFSPALRRAAADALVSRWQWRNALLNALDKQVIAP